MRHRSNPLPGVLLALDVSLLASPAHAAAFGSADPDLVFLALFVCAFAALFAAVAALTAIFVAQGANRALASLERPHLAFSCTDIGLARRPEHPRDGKPANMILEPTKYVIRNQGRGGAFIERVRLVRVPRDAAEGFPAPLDPMAEPGGIIPHGATVAPGGESLAWWTTDAPYEPGDAREDGEVEWYLLGFVIYSDGARTARYATGICCRFDRNGRRWLFEEPPGAGRRYNYARRLGWLERLIWSLRASGRAPGA